MSQLKTRSTSPPLASRADLEDELRLLRARSKIFETLVAPRTEWLAQLDTITNGPRARKWRQVAGVVLAKILAGELAVETRTYSAIAGEVAIIGGPELAQDVRPAARAVHA